MSRIGKKPIQIPQGVDVSVKGHHITVEGPLGGLKMDCHPSITVKVDKAGGRVLVENKRPDDRRCNQLHGTMRALVANLVVGVSKGFEKKMAVYGTGYSVKEQAGKLVLQVGFCHPVELKVPKGIKVQVDVAATRGNDIPAKFTLSGTDKHQLGQFAADVRKVRPPEPYKGKGVRYADEHVQRKVGKAFASGAA